MACEEKNFYKDNLYYSKVVKITHEISYYIK